MQHTSDPKAANVNIPAQTPSGRMFLNNAQVIPTGVPTVIELDSISAGFADGIEDIVNHWILPGVAGFYQFNASIQIDATASDILYILSVFKNVTVIAQDQIHSFGIENVTLNVSDIVKLTNLESLHLKLTHTKGSDETVSNVESKTFLSVQRVR